MALGSDRDRLDPVADDRLVSQLLVGPLAGNAEAVVARLLAVQAQDPRGARLAIRARSEGLLAADVDRALTERSLLITWLNRGTLHLVRSEDYWWLHALTAPRLFRGIARRLAQEGVTPDAADRAVGDIERALEANGPLTRAQLRERLTPTGVPLAGQALVILLALASLRGLIVRGPMLGGEQAFVLVRDWLGPPPGPVDPDIALGWLARRYLTGHGPAGEADLAKWAGVALRDARRGLRAIAGELDPREVGLVDLVGRSRGAGRPPPPRLLGAFDPLLLGWASRELFVGSHQGLITVNGLFRPFALVRGRAAATWSLAGGRVVLQPFAELSSDDTAALDVEATDVQRFLGRSPPVPVAG